MSVGIVALAEIGDKTQLLTLVLAGRYRKPWAIVAGIFVATLANHGLAGALGGWLTGLAGPEIVRWVLAASFFVMAAWMLIPDRLDQEGLALRRIGGVFLTTTALFFVVEIGDKTQVATVALAARFDALAPVVLGTTVGMILANAPVAWFGEALMRRLPARSMHRVAAGSFVLLGIGVLVVN